MKKAAVVVAFALLAGCAGSPVATGNAYRLRHVGSTLLIEPAAPASARAIGGAVIGTAIAARLQSSPIALKPGTDYACKYQDIVKADLSKSCRASQ